MEEEKVFQYGNKRIILDYSSRTSKSSKIKYWLPICACSSINLTEELQECLLREAINKINKNRRKLIGIVDIRQHLICDPSEGTVKFTLEGKALYK